MEHMQNFLKKYLEKNVLVYEPSPNWDTATIDTDLESVDTVWYVILFCGTCSSKDASF